MRGRCPYALTPVAATGERFRSFEPYVPAVSRAGSVVFQADLLPAEAGMGSAVFAAHPGSTPSPPQLLAGGREFEVVSHPALGGDGCCFYARFGSGERAVVVVADGRTRAIARNAGQLGPTMNEEGLCAFRVRVPGGEAVCRGNAHATERVLTVGDQIEIGGTRAAVVAFCGLPVVNASGAVACCADLAGGCRCVCVWDGGSLEVVAATGERFAAIGAFPMLDDAGRVVFAAEERGVAGCGPRSGVVLADRGHAEWVIDTGECDGFESFRGAILDGAGRIVCFATPRGGRLGVFHGPDPATDRVLGLGDELLGSTVVDFALNPVSINRAGVLAIRVGLADGRGVILRGDRVPAGPAD